MLDLPGWLEHGLNLWASSWIDLHVAEQPLPMRPAAGMENSLEAGVEDSTWRNSGAAAAPVFTGDERKIVEPGLAVRVRGPRGTGSAKVQIMPRQVAYAVRWDSSFIGKYQGAHQEKRPLAAAHGAYVVVESWLDAINPERSDLGRVALLMRYPTHGANDSAWDGRTRNPLSNRPCGITPEDWLTALENSRPVLYAMLGREKSKALTRLRRNIETEIYPVLDPQQRPEFLIHRSAYNRVCAVISRDQ